MSKGPLAALRREVRKRGRNPFGAAKARPVIVHAGQHRAGTVWFRNVLYDVANTFGLRLQWLTEAAQVRPGIDIAVYEHGGRDFDPEQLPSTNFRLTHIVRDPRDMIVSGYRYHLWTDEWWAVEPTNSWDRRTYQDMLHALPEEEGIAAEIRLCSQFMFIDMAAEKWRRPEVMQFHYEDLIADEAGTFGAIFRHYGFTEPAVTVAVERALAHGFTATTGRAIGEEQAGSHLFSGKPGRWRETLTPRHLELFNALNPGLLEQLGYPET